MKFDIWVCIRNLWRKLKFSYNLTRITGTLLEDWYVFFIISCLILPRVRSVLGRSCRVNQCTHFMFSNFPTPKKNWTIYEIKWKNTAETDRPHMTIWRMCTAFLLLRFMYTACHVVSYLTLLEDSVFMLLQQCFALCSHWILEKTLKLATQSCYGEIGG